MVVSFVRSTSKWTPAYDLTIKLTYLVAVDIQKGYNLLKVFVRFYGVAYEAVEVREWQCVLPIGLVVGELLGLLVEFFPGLRVLVFDDKGGLRAYLVVLVDGKNVQGLNGFDTVLYDGCVVSVVPPLGGG